MSENFVRRRTNIPPESEDELDDSDAMEVQTEGDEDARSAYSAAYDEQSSSSTAGRRRRGVKFTGNDRDEPAGGEDDLYPGGTDSLSEPGDISRQSTISRVNSLGRQSSMSRQDTIFSRQISNLSRSSTFKAVMDRTATLSRTLTRSLTRVVTRRYEFETEEEVEEAAAVLEEARARRLEQGEGGLERVTTMMMRAPEKLGRQLTENFNFARQKTLAAIRDFQEVMDSPEMKAKLKKAKKRVNRMATGRPQWDPEPAKVPLPSSCNLCTLIMALMALWLPLVFFFAMTRNTFMGLVVKDWIGEEVGSSLPPLSLPALGEVCSSGGFGQQALQPGSPTLDSTWWSTALGDGAQIQLQSTTGDLWWSHPPNPTAFTGQVYANPPSPPSPPVGTSTNNATSPAGVAANAAPYPPTPPSPPLATTSSSLSISPGAEPPPPPPPAFTPPPSGPDTADSYYPNDTSSGSSPPSNSSYPDLITGALNGTFFLLSDFNCAVFNATDDMGDPLAGTFFQDYFYPGLIFNVTNPNATDGSFEGFNYTSGQGFSGFSFDVPEVQALGELPSLVSGHVTNATTMDGEFVAGTLYEGVLYNNSFQDLADMSSLSRVSAGGSSRKRKLLQIFSPVATSSTGASGNTPTAPPPPPSPPPPSSYSTYAAWTTGPIGLYTTNTPNTTEFITVSRINTTNFYLRAPNGNYIVSTSTGELVAVSPAKTPQGIFSANVIDSKRLELITYDGQYVGWGSSDGSGALMSYASPNNAQAALGSSPALDYTTFNVREVSKVARMRGVNLGGWLVVEEWMTPWLYGNVPDLIDGWQLQLQSATTGKFITLAQNNNVHASAVTAGNTETWNVRRSGGPHGGMLLRSSGAGFYMYAQNGGGSQVFANTPYLSNQSYEVFTLSVNPGNGNQIRLQANNSQYLRANSDGELTADGSGSTGWGGDTSFNLQRVGAVQGEWQISSGDSNAVGDLTKHRTTFITETDWAYMASLGINTVRVPIGYWMMQGSSPDYPFVPGSLALLDQAFTFAEKYNIRIWLSMHAAPGGQNPGHECASRDGIIDWGRAGTPYVQETLNAIDFFAGRYAKSSAFFGFGVLNEPNVAGPSTVQDLKDYQIAAYNIVRSHSTCAFVGISGFIGGNDSDFDGHMSDPLQYNNVVYDVHYYQVFDPTTFAGHNVDWHLNYTKTVWGAQIAALQQGGRTVLVGEWSLGLPSDVHASNHDYVLFSQAQLETYDNASAGWFYWSLKVDQGSTGFPNWSLEDAFPRGWLHY